MRPASTPAEIKLSRTDSGAAFAETAIVFRGPAFIGESGDDDFAGVSIHELSDLLNLSALGRANVLTVVIKIDGLKLIAVDVAAEKRCAFASLGQRRAADVIASRSRALSATFFAATRKRENENDDWEQSGIGNEAMRRRDHRVRRESSGCDLECKRSTQYLERDRHTMDQGATKTRFSEFQNPGARVAAFPRRATRTGHAARFKMLRVRSPMM